MINFVKDGFISAFWNSLRDYTSMEVVYKDLFERELASIGLKDVYYPVNGAANYSLLYLIVRITRNFDIKSVLELGSGQSTILLSNLIDGGIEIAVDSLEQNSSWAEEIRKRAPRVNVINSNIERKVVDGITFFGYDFSQIGSGRYNLIIVDGPNGTPWLSRFSGVEAMMRCANEDFIIIVDDAERFGERRMLREMYFRLGKMGIKFNQSTTRALKWQVVIATRKYGGAIFL